MKYKSILFTVIGCLLLGKVLAATYYVAPTGNDFANGTSWATAKLTIQNAIDTSGAGDTIVVTNGTYTPISTANKAVTIASVNGAAVTIIDGGSTNRVATLGSAESHTNTTIIGFTLQNGNAGDGGGSYFGTLNNCALIGNTACFGGGSSYGTLNNCTLTGNTAEYGGGSYFGSLNNCTLSSNMAGYKGGPYGYTLDNCTLSDNAADDSGNPYDDTLDYCTLSDNTADDGGDPDDDTLDYRTLSGNMMGYGGGSYGGTLNNCTLTGNTANYYGGGSYEGNLSNCIVWGNHARFQEYINIFYSTVGFTLSDQVFSGEGNIAGDPLFVAVERGDYRLRSGSPALNAGANEYVIGTTDISGNPRIQDGIVDMGAYEGGIATIAVLIEGAGEILSDPLETVVPVGDAIAFTALPCTNWVFRHYLTNGVFASDAMTFTWHDISQDGTLAAVFSYALVKALDNPRLEWITSGDTDWIGQTNVTYDGVAAAASGAITHEQESRLETWIEGPGELRFWWKVSSEDGFDWLELYVDNMLHDGITGEVDWEECILELEAGNHLLSWCYTKDRVDWDPTGADRGWVDQVSFVPYISLADALDNTNLMWTTGGSAEWLGQPYHTHDGIDAAESAEIGNNQESWLQTIVAGPGTLSFWWAVSSEDRYDWLELYIDGVRQDRISGETSWSQRSTNLDTGAHTIRWRYIKDRVDLEPVGQDRGWVDQVVFTPAGVGSIPQEWLQQYGLPADGSADAADPDGDSYTNYQEWIAGTDPTNSNSRLRGLLVREYDAYVLRWEPDLTNAVPPRRYSINSTTNLQNSFIGLTNNLPAGTPFTIDLDVPTRFFKIEVHIAE